MILAKNNYADILIFIMENAKSTLTFRRKKPLQKIISQLEHNSTQSAFIKLSQKKMDNIFPNENYVDIRYLHKNNLPPQLVTILANHRITITTIDEK